MVVYFNFTNKLLEYYVKINLEDLELMGQKSLITMNGVIKIRKTSKLLGIIAAVASIIMWFVLKPSEYEPMMNTLFSLALPAVMAIIASLTTFSFLMLIAFVWSLPISLYMMLTPSYFALFGITCVSYLISFILMLLDKKRRKQEQQLLSN